jgi:hypothetical protein
VTLAENQRAIRKVAQLLRKHGVVYRDIQIGRSDRRDATYAIVTLANGTTVTGDLAILTKAYAEFGASGVNVEDTFIAKCLMLHP